MAINAYNPTTLPVYNTPSIYEPGSTAGVYTTTTPNLFTGGANSNSSNKTQAAYAAQLAQNPAYGATAANTVGTYYGYSLPYDSPARSVGYGTTGASKSWADMYGGSNTSAYAPYMSGTSGSGDLTSWAAIKAARDGGSSSTGNSTWDSLLNAYQQAYEEGKAINEQRYEDILGGYRDRYANAMDMVGQLGDSQRAEIDRSYTGLNATTQQGLTDRGLANSSITDTMAAGVEREKQRASLELEDALLSRQLDTANQLSGDTLGFMERRQDEYPSLDQLMNFYVQMGQAQQAANQPTGSYYGMSAPASMSVPNYYIPSFSAGSYSYPSSYYASGYGVGYSPTSSSSGSSYVPGYQGPGYEPFQRTYWGPGAGYYDAINSNVDMWGNGGLIA